MSCMYCLRGSTKAWRGVNSAIPGGTTAPHQARAQRGYNSVLRTRCRPVYKTFNSVLFSCISKKEAPLTCLSVCQYIIYSTLHIYISALHLLHIYITALHLLHRYRYRYIYIYIYLVQYSPRQTNKQPSKNASHQHLLLPFSSSPPTTTSSPDPGHPRRSTRHVLQLLRTSTSYPLIHILLTNTPYNSTPKTSPPTHTHIKHTHKSRLFFLLFLSPL